MCRLAVQACDRRRIKQLASSSFQHGAEIPVHYATDRKDVSPELSWGEAPAGTRSFALIVHDPDAPRPGGFTHWTAYNIPPETSHIEENAPRIDVVSGFGTQGKNDEGKIGYMGPAPPSGTHRYFFRLYALNATLELAAGATPKEVSAAMKGHVIAPAELMGTYQNKRERAA